MECIVRGRIVVRPSPALLPALQERAFYIFGFRSMYGRCLLGAFSSFLEYMIFMASWLDA